MKNVKIPTQQITEHVGMFNRCTVGHDEVHKRKCEVAVFRWTKSQESSVCIRNRKFQFFFTAQQTWKLVQVFFSQIPSEFAARRTNESQDEVLRIHEF